MEEGGRMPVTMSGTARRRWLVWVSILGLVPLVGEPAHATRQRRANVRLEGYVGQAPAGVQTEARVMLQYGGKTYEFDVTRTAVNTGDRSRQQLLRDIRPFQNTLVLRGSASMLGALSSASSGQQLVISGYHRTGSRELRVTQISPAPPGPTPAAQPH